MKTENRDFPNCSSGRLFSLKFNRLSSCFACVFFRFFSIWISFIMVVCRFAQRYLVFYYFICSAMYETLYNGFIPIIKLITPWTYMGAFFRVASKRTLKDNTDFVIEVLLFTVAAFMIIWTVLLVLWHVRTFLSERAEKYKENIVDCDECIEEVTFYRNHKRNWDEHVKNEMDKFRATSEYIGWKEPLASVDTFHRVENYK